MEKKWKTKFNPENYKSKNFTEEIIDAKSKKTIIKKGEKINFLKAKKALKKGQKKLGLKEMVGKKNVREKKKKNKKFKKKKK